MKKIQTLIIVALIIIATTTPSFAALKTLKNISEIKSTVSPMQDFLKKKNATKMPLKNYFDNTSKNTSNSISNSWTKLLKKNTTKSTKSTLTSQKSASSLNRYPILNGVEVQYGDHISSYDMAVDDRGRIHVVFTARTIFMKDPNQKVVYYTYSDDGGQTWSKNKLVSKADGRYSVLGAKIETCGKEIMISWASGFSGMWLNYSSDYGETWGSDTSIADTGWPGSLDHSVYADKLCNFHYTWTEVGDETGKGWYLKHSMTLDGGTTWQNLTQVSDQIDWVTAFDSEMVQTASGRLYVVWRDGRRYGDYEVPKVYLDYSDDNGKTWSSQDILVSGDAQWLISYAPEIIEIEPNKIMIAFENITGEASEVSIVYSIIYDGTNFSNLNIISGEKDWYGTPEIAQDSSGYTVCFLKDWYRNSGGRQIACRHSKDGKKWNPQVIVEKENDLLISSNGQYSQDSSIMEIGSGGNPLVRVEGKFVFPFIGQNMLYAHSEKANGNTISFPIVFK